VNLADFSKHLLSFVAPAFALAILVAAAGRLVLPRSVPRAGWWPSVALNFIAGVAVLAGGLWYFGRDGKMATYATMVVVVATCQWLAGRGWRG
jgi:hypothetical protein